MDASNCIKATKLTWTLLKYTAYLENKRHSLKTKKKLFDICYFPYLEYVYMNEPKEPLKSLHFHQEVVHTTENIYIKARHSESTH